MTERQRRQQQRRPRGLSATYANESERLAVLEQDKSVLTLPLLHKANWIPNDERPQCYFCARTFRVPFVRKHHCRGCGEVVCRSCNRYRKVRVAARTRTVRLCFDCMDKAAIGRSGNKRQGTTSYQNALSDEAATPDCDGVLCHSQQSGSMMTTWTMSSTYAVSPVAASISSREDSSCYDSNSNSNSIASSSDSDYESDTASDCSSRQASLQATSERVSESTPKRHRRVQSSPAIVEAASSSDYDCVLLRPRSEVRAVSLQCVPEELEDKTIDARVMHAMLLPRATTTTRRRELYQLIDPDVLLPPRLNRCSSERTVTTSARVGCPVARVTRSVSTGTTAAAPSSTQRKGEAAYPISYGRHRSASSIDNSSSTESDVCIDLLHRISSTQQLLARQQTALQFARSTQSVNAAQTESGVESIESAMLVLSTSSRYGAEIDV